MSQHLIQALVKRGGTTLALAPDNPKLAERDEARYSHQSRVDMRPGNLQSKIVDTMAPSGGSQL